MTVRKKVTERSIPRPARVQIRMDGDAGAQFIGYASTTGDAYAVRDWLGEYSETILPGAFRKTLQEQKAVPLLRNHDPNYVLASTASGTSRLAEDNAGLRNEADLDRRQSHTNDLCISLERGDVGTMSFAFSAVKDTWNAAYDKRTVSELKLFDTSIVTNPANPNTTAGLRAAMRSELGREGRTILLASHEPSVRSELPSVLRGDGIGPRGEELFERAFRALTHADEQVSLRYGVPCARTARVASAMLELRAGRVLSAENEQLLETALSALSDAGTHHQSAHDAISTVLGNASGEGMDGNQGAATGGNPISPQDGAGPRSADARAQSLRLKRERELELRRRGSRQWQIGQRSSAEMKAEREAELRMLRRNAAARRSESDGHRER